MSAAANDERLAFTVAQLCARWGATRKCVMRAIHEGRLRPFRVGARVYRVSLAEVERFERAQAA